MADNQGVEIPGFPPELLGPTGRVFLHKKGRGYSTHLNFVTSDVPGLEGKHAIVPLLVPGQKNVNELLEGGKSGAKPEHFKRAIKWASEYVKAGGQLPAYDSPEDALSAEKQWHDQAEQAGLPYVQPYMTTTRPSKTFNRGNQVR
jgi:hypothetical protein